MTVVESHLLNKTTTNILTLIQIDWLSSLIQWHFGCRSIEPDRKIPRVWFATLTRALRAGGREVLHLLLQVAAAKVHYVRVCINNRINKRQCHGRLIDRCCLHDRHPFYSVGQ